MKEEEANLLLLHKTQLYWQRGQPSSSEEIKYTRLRSTVFFKSKGVFCQPTTDEEQPKVHEKLQKGKFLVTWEKTIQEIVNSSGYHHTSRFTKNWEKYFQRPCCKAKSLENRVPIIQPPVSVAFIATDREFFSVVQDHVDEGQYINIAELQKCRFFMNYKTDFAETFTGFFWHTGYWIHNNNYKHLTKVKAYQSYTYL